VDVPDLAMRGVKPGRRRARAASGLVLGLLAASFAACAPSAEDVLSSSESAYLNDAASRRRALVASLVNPANAYSTLRLRHYASGDADDWDLLPDWNPRAAPVAAAELDAPTPVGTLPADAASLSLDEAASLSPAALHALGEAAFFRYPAQLAPATSLTLTRDGVSRYGLWIDAARGVGGLVRAEVASGGAMLALSCASCHADVVAGRLVAGVPSGRLDLGLVLVDASGAAPTSSLAAWGPGRVDVTTADGSVPERISDLRPLRWVSHLQYDATVRQTDLVALAIRIETLILTSHGQAVRPPRIVALALARYLWDLAETLPAPPPASSDGARVFASRCAGCHAGVGLTGAPRALEEVGTDPTLGLSPDRGTGFYRVPSLRGVALRPTLLHDGTLADLDALLEPTRLSAGYVAGVRGAGPVGGHAFGLDLSAPERASLLGYLRAL
jgi:hypothetical protein